MHRLTGLGVVFFFIIHVVDTSWAAFYPDLYEKAIAAYQTPLFTIGEFFLVFAVVYHAINGLRISFFDFRPEMWQHQERAAWGVWGVTILILVPFFLSMAGHAIVHYQDPEFVLPLGEVLVEQIPFIIGMVAAAGAALVLSFAYGMVAGNETSTTPAKHRGSVIERFWWSFMRASGVIIVFLVFGHLIGIHIIQGVFDITAAGMTVVATGQVNVSGTATEFVMHRWGVGMIRLFDTGLLVLAGIHGFNGLRYVLTDYTMDNPVLRRASVYLCIIGALILLVVGGSALLSTIDETQIALAEEALQRMKDAHGAG